MWYRNDFCKQELTLNDVAFALEKTHGDGFNFMLRSFARIDKGLGNDGLNLKLQINGINSRLVLALRILTSTFIGAVQRQTHNYVSPESSSSSSSFERLWGLLSFHLAHAQLNIRNPPRAYT